MAVADVIVVAAEAVGSHYGIPGDVSVVVHAPVDIARFPVASRIPRRPHDPFRIGLFANWNPIKDHITFLHAIAEVRATGLDVRAVLAGARLDSHREYARAVDQAIIDLGLTDAVEQLGFVVDVPGMMATLDAVALSSRSEASPMAVLEAMASGLPVVATDVGGVREMLCRKGETAGIVVAVQSSAGMASAFARLIAQVGLAARMGAAGRRVAEEVFSLPRCVDQHVAFYRRALSAHADRSDHSDGMPHAA